MARRRKKSITVSLFPFMSILACVIGTLTLMLTAMALGQMDNEVVYSGTLQEGEDQNQPGAATYSGLGAAQGGGRRGRGS